MHPFEPETVPDLTRKPVFIAAGESDPYAPKDQVENLADTLRRAGARVEVSWTPGGHGLGPRDIAAARQWFDQEATPASGAS